MVKKMFIGIGLCNPMTYVFKRHMKIVKIYLVKFNVSILNRLKIMVFFANSKCIHKPDVIFNKTVTKLVTILAKSFFPYLNPTSYLNIFKSNNFIFNNVFKNHDRVIHVKIKYGFVAN